MGILDGRISDFLNELSSDSPTPGGGSVAGLCGAIGGALVSMVANLTLGREKYAAVQDRMADLVEKAQAMQRRYLDLAERDMEAFRAYMKALKMPRATDEERNARAAALAAAARDATAVPLETMELSEALMRLALEALEHGNRNAASDAVAAAQIANATAQIASCKVFKNAHSCRINTLRTTNAPTAESCLAPSTPRTPPAKALMITDTAPIIIPQTNFRELGASSDVRSVETHREAKV